MPRPVGNPRLLAPRGNARCRHQVVAERLRHVLVVEPEHERVVPRVLGPRSGESFGDTRRERQRARGVRLVPVVCDSSTLHVRPTQTQRFAHPTPLAREEPVECRPASERTGSPLRRNRRSNTLPVSAVRLFCFTRRVSFRHSPRPCSRGAGRSLLSEPGGLRQGGPLDAPRREVVVLWQTMPPFASVTTNWTMPSPLEAEPFHVVLPSIALDHPAPSPSSGHVILSVTSQLSAEYLIVPRHGAAGSLG